MKELLETIAKALVNQPDAVNVTQIDKEDGQIVFELRVAEEDMGKVIGKQGRIKLSAFVTARIFLRAFLSCGLTAGNTPPGRYDIKKII